MIENLKWDNRGEGETPLRQMQLVGVRLLRVLDTVCKEIDVKYFLMYGPLLGALRHKGFIPWDDDIDLVMEESDYMKFLKLAPKYLPEDVWLQCRETDETYKLPWAKLRDAYSSVYSNQEDFDSGCHVGISLDIFPWFRYPSDGMQKIWSCLHHLTFTTTWFVCNRHSSSFKVRLFGNFLRPLESMLMLIWRLSFLFNKKRILGMHPQVGSTCKYLRYRPEDVYPLSEIEFEGLRIPAPHNSAAALKTRYGADFMQPPPDNMRMPHEKFIFPYTKCLHPRALSWPYETALKKKSL